MLDDATRGWWRGEIAKCERELIEAAPREKFKVWRRLDLLHAPKDDCPAEGRPTAPPRQQHTGTPAFRQRGSPRALSSSARSCCVPHSHGSSAPGSGSQSSDLLTDMRPAGLLSDCRWAGARAKRESHCRSKCRLEQ
jgi:hypothetical protein